MSSELKDRPASSLAEAIERQIDRRTWHQVQHLVVEHLEDRIVIRGWTRSYYVKQLAVQACLEVLSPLKQLRIETAIEVGTGDASAWRVGPSSAPRPSGGRQEGMAASSAG